MAQILTPLKKNTNQHPWVWPLGWVILKWLNIYLHKVQIPTKLAHHGQRHWHGQQKKDEMKLKKFCGMAVRDSVNGLNPLPSKLIELGLLRKLTFLTVLWLSD